jgi:hypothetical protein
VVDFAPKIGFGYDDGETAAHLDGTKCLFLAGGGFGGNFWLREGTMGILGVWDDWRRVGCLQLTGIFS